MAKEPKRTTKMYCPRCDRAYTAEGKDSYMNVLKRVISHVAEQHPDHDPEWYDTYPHKDEVK